MRRYSKFGTWRGGLPVERGSFPATLEWRPVRDTTDNLELFMGWVDDIEAVLATVGLSMVSTQRGDGSVEWMAAGHKVAELRKPFGGGVVGTVYARPVGGPGPGVRGAVAAEELRRSSQWLGYGGGYGADKAHPVVEAEEGTGTPGAGTVRWTAGSRAPGIRTDTFDAEVGEEVPDVSLLDPGRLDLLRNAAPRLRAAFLEGGDRLDDANAEADALEASGKPLVAGGGALTALGVVGGLVSIFARGKLGAVGAIAGGIASAGAGGGGITLIVKGKRRIGEASRLRGLASGKMEGPQDLAYLTRYDNQQAFYNTMEKPHEIIAAEIQLFAKSSPDFAWDLMKRGFDPGVALLCDYQRNHYEDGDDLHPPGDWIDAGSFTNCRDYRGTAEYPPSGNQRLMAERIQAYLKDCSARNTHPDMGPACLDLLLTGRLPREIVTPGRAIGITGNDPLTQGGKPLWAVLDTVRSESSYVTVRSPGGERSVSGWINHTTLVDDEGNDICTIRHHRYADENNLGWWKGNFDNSQRGGSGQLDDLKTSDPGKRMAWIVWGPGYSNWKDSGGPPLGFIMKSNNAWLEPVNSTGGSIESPFAQLDGLADNDQIYPLQLRGPMAALTQLYRMLRAANPEVVSIYFPTAEDVFQAVEGAAKKEDHRAWWYSVGDYVGTILGIAAMCCEVAAPIISTVNPAAGAVIGGTISGLISGVGGVIEDVKHRNAPGAVGGVLDVMRSLGWSSTTLQDKLKEGYSQVTNLYDNVGQMVTGWADMRGSFVPTDMEVYKDMGGDVLDVLDPAEQLAWFNKTVIEGASSGILNKVNNNPKTPFNVKMLTAYTTIPQELGLQNFPLTDLSEAYKDNRYW